MEKIDTAVVFLLLIAGILLIPAVAEKIDDYLKRVSIYKEAVYLFENYEYDLQELIKKNNLTKRKQLWGYCFDTDEQIKELAENLTTVYDVQRWILEFPYDESNNLSTTCQRATVTLKKGKGICNDKAILTCSIFYEKNIPCYVIGGCYNGSHAISLIYYNNAWRPVLTTGYIDREKIDKFMDSLFLIESKYERYFRNI